MKKTFCIVFTFLLLALTHISSAQYKNTKDFYEQYEMRRKVVLSAIAGQSWMPGNDSRARIYRGVAKLYSDIDAETGLEFLKESIDDSTHWGCFNTYSLMDALLRLENKIPCELAEKGKLRLAQNFGKDKGFTDNHKLQYRTARYLFGQTWPDGPVFADGMTPLQAKAEAENWIYQWIDRTVTIGMYEYDSVNYHSLYYLCFTSLYDFAKDPLMKRKAWMMMQLLLADWAPEYLYGNWIGSHSREKYNQVTHTVLNCGVAIPFGYLFFGMAPFHPEVEETAYSGLAAVQGFRPVPIIGNIATTRQQPYVHRETKAPRKGIGICTSETPVWKYDYVTKDYALCSSYGDISAVENHRWDLTWVSKNDGSTCFFINPSYSAEQLLKYFDSTPDKIVQDIVRQRPYYENPNKWIEGSPFEELLQYKNTIIALYDIPEKERNGHVNGFFSKIIEQRIKDSGWIFCSTDSIYFAVKTLTKGKWNEEKDHYRLTLNNRKTGVIMEVAQKSKFDSFESFQRQIKANKLGIKLNDLSVSYTNCDGDKLEFTYQKQRLINGQKIDFEKWPLFDGPFVKSAMGSKIFEITDGTEKMILDFNNFSVLFSN